MDHAIIPEYECATDILDILLRPVIKETIKFSHPDAQMVNFQIKPGSPMVGVSLASFPKQEILEHIRVMRDSEIVVNLFFRREAADFLPSTKSMLQEISLRLMNCFLGPNQSLP